MNRNDFPYFKSVVASLCFWSLIFSLAAFTQIENSFVPIKQAYAIKKNASTELTIAPMEANGFLLQTTVQTAKPHEDPVYKDFSVFVNERKISSDNSTTFIRRQQVNWIVPADFFVPNEESKIVINLPKPSLKDHPVVTPEFKLFNYKYISPNAPVAFVTFDRPANYSELSASEILKTLFLVFCIVFLSFALCHFILNFMFYRNVAEGVGVLNPFFIVASLLPVSTFFYGLFTVYEVIFPYATLFWLIILTLVIYILVGTLLVGTISPRVNEILIPNNSQGSLFARKLFQGFHERIIILVENYHNTFIFKAILYGLLFFHVGLFLFPIIKYTVNVPFGDDLVLVSPLAQIFDARTLLGEKLHLIFVQHSEHRVLAYKIIMWVLYIFSGEINFKVSSIVGSLSVPLILILLYGLHRGSHFKNLYFLPVTFFILSFNIWFYFMGPLGSMAMYLVIWLAGVTLWFLNKANNASFAFSIFFGALTVFSHACGPVVLASGQLLLICKKNYWKAIVWFLFGLACAAVYLQGYYLGDAATWQVEGEVNPLTFTLFYLTFLGSSLAKGKVSLAVIVGVASIVYFLFLIKIKYYSTNPVVFFFMLYFLLVGFALGYGRTSFGVSSALSTRYQLYSTTLMVLFYISVFETFLKGKQRNRVLIAFYLSLFIFSFNMASLKENMPRVKQEKLNYIAAFKPYVHLSSQGAESHEIIVTHDGIRDALNRKIYYLPCAEMFPGEAIDNIWCK